MEGKPINPLIEKIAKECEEANAGKWTITRIVKELHEMEGKSPSRMRARALQVLQNLDPKAASTYASFQRMQVRTSRETVEAFDRGNIIKSLLRETDVPRGVAEKIGHEVEEKIKDLGVGHINTGLIREMVNVKLLEYGHEKIRDQYTRLGLPVFEVKKRVEKAPYTNKAIMTEYNLLAVIPRETARLHLEKEIHIACLADFSTKPVALGFTPQPGKNARETAFQALKKARVLSRLASWPCNTTYPNASFSVRERKGNARKAGETFLLGMEALFAGKKQERQGTALLCLFEPDEFAKQNVGREEMYSTANHMLSTGERQGKRLPLQLAIAVDSKYKLKLLRRKHARLLVANQKNKEFRVFNSIPGEGQGICSLVELNLPLIAFKSRGNESLFLEELGEKAEAVSKVDALKRKQLRKRKYLEKGGVSESNLFSAVGLYSLAGSAGLLLGGEKEREILEMCERAVEAVKSRLDENFVITSAGKPGEARFKERNRKQFKENGKEKESALLSKSRYLQKNSSFTAIAESKKHLSELIDSQVKMVEARLGSGK